MKKKEEQKKYLRLEEKKETRKIVGEKRKSLEEKEEKNGELRLGKVKKLLERFGKLLPEVRSRSKLFQNK